MLKSLLGIKKREQKTIITTLVFAILLSIFAHFFVASSYELLKIKNLNTFATHRTIIIASAVAMAFLCNWFFKKIK